VSPTIISLLAVTIGFTLLVLWVYWPSRKNQVERHGSIPLDDEHDASVQQKEQSQ